MDIYEFFIATEASYPYKLDLIFPISISFSNTGCNSFQLRRRKFDIVLQKNPVFLTLIRNEYPCRSSNFQSTQVYDT